MKLSRILFVLIAPAVLGCTEPIRPNPQPSAVVAPPNVIVILTDDQAASTIQHMSHVQSLSAEGTAFSNAFVTTSVCCPSRTSLLRGQYAHNHGIITSNAPTGGFEKTKEVDHTTLATLLDDAGYETAMIGKYMNQYRVPEDYAYVAPGWDLFHVAAGTPVRKAAVNGLLVNFPDRPHNSDHITAQALTFIRSQSGPFFLYLAYQAPHLPATPAARHAGMFAGVAAPRPPSFNVPGSGPAARASMDAEAIAASDALWRSRLESLQSVNDGIDSIVRVLQERSMLANTLVIYTSDNGVFSGEHALVDLKDRPYEEAIRVPLVVRGPGVRKGAVRPQFALNIDLAPTILDFAGVPIPAFMDGRSLKPILTKTVVTWRTAFLVENWIPESPGSGTVGWSVAGVRDRNFLYAEWASGYKERYDLRRDPYQLNNLGPTRSYREWLAEFRTCAGASCRVLDTR